MLVLARLEGESIVINGDIRVCVVEVNGSVVRLGVEAPADVPVHREEVQQRIERQNERNHGAGKQR